MEKWGRNLGKSLKFKALRFSKRALHIWPSHAKSDPIDDSNLKYKLDTILETE